MKKKERRKKEEQKRQIREKDKKDSLAGKLNLQDIEAVDK